MPAPPAYQGGPTMAQSGSPPSLCLFQLQLQFRWLAKEALAYRIPYAHTSSSSSWPVKVTWCTQVIQGMLLHKITPSRQREVVISPIDTNTEIQTE